MVPAEISQGRQSFHTVDLTESNVINTSHRTFIETRIYHGHIYLQCLAVQQHRHLLKQIFNNGIRATLDLQALGNGMQLDIGSNRPSNLVDLRSLLSGPHRGAELFRALI